MNIHNPLLEITDKTPGAGWTPCYRVANQDGKEWVLPARHLRVAMELYQPTHYKGVLMKRFFPLLHRIGAMRKAIGAQMVGLRITDALRNILYSLFGTAGCEVSYFGGTPGSRQKVTLQLFKGEKILGYLKYTTAPEIDRLFVHECEVLNELRKKGVRNIPRVLYYGKVEGTYLFLQSTAKTLHSTSENQLTEAHIRFVASLCRKTMATMSFEQTGIARDIEYLRSISDNLTERNRKATENAMEVIAYHYKNVSKYCLTHGDFTPWNLYMERGEVHAFDFEYAEEGYPPYLDLVHFMLQAEILVKHADSEAAFAGLEAQKHRLPVADADYLIVVYLLRIVAFYNRLFCGNFNPQDRSYIIWIDLLTKYTDLCQKEKF